MPRSSSDPVLACQTTGALLEHVGSAGLDARTVARDHKLGDEAVAAPSIDVGIAARAELFDDVAHRLADDAVGVSLALAVAPGRYREPERLALRAPDLRTAARHLMARGRELNPLTRFALAEHGDAAVLLHDVGGGLSPGRHVGEFVIAYVVRLARQIVGAEFPVRYAWFDHEAPADAARLAALLGTTDLRFGARGRGVCFDASLLRLRARAPDPAAPAPAGDAPEVPVTARARAVLANRDVPVDELALARALKMSVRTLRRRLAVDGNGYRELREEAIHQQARRWLADTDRPIDEIARQLGYAYPANFARAFRRATGVSPARYRTSAKR